MNNITMVENDKQASANVPALPSLYELTDEYRRALTELVDMDDEAVMDTLEGLKGTVEAKSVNVAAFARSLEHLAAGIKEAEARMKERRTALENKAAKLRDYVKESLESCGLKRVETPQIKLAIYKSPAALEVSNAELIPSDYIVETVVKRVDKPRLKKALAEGAEIPGAMLIENRTRLSIK